MACDGYIVGQQPRFKAEFRVGAILTDPTTVKFRYQTPGQSVIELVYGTDPELVRSATGVYYFDWLIASYAAGYWSWRWIGTDPVDAADQGRFLVYAATP